MDRAVFLDRDGVINPLVERTNYDGYRSLTTSPWLKEEFNIYPWVPEALALLKSLGYKLILVTNQPEVGNGILQPETLTWFHDKLKSEYGFDHTYTCSDKTSDHYKPGNAAVMMLINQYDIDPSRSYMVGDRWKDIVCGFNSGLQTIKINRVWDPPPQYQHILPNFWVPTLLAAATIIRDGAVPGWPPGDLSYA